MVPAGYALLIADADSLPVAQRGAYLVAQCGTQIPDERRTLLTVQLYDVKLVVHYTGDDVLCHFVDKDTHSLR